MSGERIDNNPSSWCLAFYMQWFFFRAFSHVSIQSIVVWFDICLLAQLLFMRTSTTLQYLSIQLFPSKLTELKDRSNYLTQNFDLLSAFVCLEYVGSIFHFFCFRRYYLVNNSSFICTVLLVGIVTVLFMALVNFSLTTHINVV